MIVEMIVYTDTDFVQKSTKRFGFSRRVHERRKFTRSFNGNPWDVVPLNWLTKVEGINALGDGSVNGSVMVHVERVELFGKDDEENSIVRLTCWHRVPQRLVSTVIQQLRASEYVLDGGPVEYDPYKSSGLPVEV